MLHIPHLFPLVQVQELAIEDAIELSKCLTDDYQSLELALESYQANRKVKMSYLLDASYNSMIWFENIHQFKTLDIDQFSHVLLNRRKGI